MLSVFQTDVLLNELIRRVVFSVFTGALWLLIALSVLRLINVKNPAVKYIFYTLVLAKSFFALIREQPAFIQAPGRITVFGQFPNPGAIVPNFLDAGHTFFWGSSSIALGPGIVALAAAMLFLGWRFSAFLRFQRIISTAPEIERKANKAFFATLDRLVEKAHVAYPRVISVNSSDAPFTVGLKRPVIALSPPLLNQLGDDEIEAVLAHEVAHIVRRDHFYHWPLVIMRDVLFFNPFTYVIYRRLSFERERACDDFSFKLCGPLKLAKSLVKIAEIRKAQPLWGWSKAFAPQSFLSERKQSYFSRRVTALIEPISYPALSRPRRILLWLSALIFFSFEIHISFLVNGVRVIIS